MRTKAEIEEVRSEASLLLREARRLHRLKPTATRKRDALSALLKAMVEHRAVELGAEVNEISLADVLVTDDEKAVARELWKASGEAGLELSIGHDDTIDHVVARRAIERGWSIMDAARAIADGADASVDALRNGPQHAKARRVSKALRKVIAERVADLDRQLAATEGRGPALDAAEIALRGAIAAFETGVEVSLELLVDTARRERDRLARILGE